ncbi:MAG: MerR family transcriptional regulator [Rubricoccaceae bacterium]|nr:MerR family transcriptional regulator [Rubricoccaceae bacterium]
MPASSSDLLSLGEAAALLGVHPATLRRWSDQGDVLVMVTPGGHRRFPRTEVERLRGVDAAQDEGALAGLLVDRALARTRAHLPEQASAVWMAGFDEEERREKRASGRRLMELLRLALAADDGEPTAIFEEVRQIGQAYADDARAHDLALTDVLRAVTFFRDQTTEGVLAAEAVAADPEAGRRALRRVNGFFSALLLAAAAAYD